MAVGCSARALDWKKRLYAKCTNNEAADKLANMGAEIEEGHRVVERGSAEPPPAQEEHIDNG